MKTKLFVSPRYYGDTIDEQINEFLENNNIEIVDIKLSTMGELPCALLIYKEKGE